MQITEADKRRRRRRVLGSWMGGIGGLLAVAAVVVAATPPLVVHVLPTRTSSCTITSVTEVLARVSKGGAKNIPRYQSSCGRLDVVGDGVPIPITSAVGSTYLVRYTVGPLWPGRIVSAERADG